MVKRTRFSTAVVALGIAGISASAFAADMPVKAPRLEAVAPSGVYVWIDGSYQSIKLPSFALGFKLRSPVGDDLGPSETYDPRVRGYGVAGAVGYIFPYGTFSPFGSNARLELGGSYVRATGSQSGAGPVFSLFTPVNVNGIAGASTACLGAGCQTTSILQTDYKAWQVNLKAAGDFRLAAATVTPSVQVFGGEAHNDQGFQQVLNALPAATVNSVYDATVSTRWTDVGLKLGLDASVPLDSWVSFGLGGSIGAANRRVSLAAADAGLLLGAGGPLPSPVPGAISTSAITTAYLANAEARLTFMPWSNVALKAFGGLNYDSRVPGISTPVLAKGGGPPAGITYARETSYYAGGRLTVKLAPPAVAN